MYVWRSIRTYLSRAVSTRRRVFVTVLVVLTLCFLGLVTFRAEVRIKGMVDAGSLGSEQLSAAYRSGNSEAGSHSLVLAAEHFARLDSSLEHWSWIIAVSNIVPPARRQFSVMEAVAEAGLNLVAAPGYRNDQQFNGRVSARGSDHALCSARERLESVDRRAYFQLIETADELKDLIDEIAPNCT